MSRRQYLSMMMLLATGCSGRDGPDSYNLAVTPIDTPPEGIKPTTPDADCVDLDSDIAVSDKDPDQLIEEAIQKSKETEDDLYLQINEGQFKQFQEVLRDCNNSVSNGKIYIEESSKVIIVEPIVVREG